MAYFYTIAAPGASLAQDKCMLGLFNGVGSGYIIKLYRAWVLNNQTQVQSTNLLNRMSLWRFTTGSGGTPVMVVKHDSTNPTLPSSIVASTNMTYTKDVIFRTFIWSSDEPIASDGNATLGQSGLDEWQTVPSLNMPIDNWWSYNSTIVEPIILRPGYGIGLNCDSAWTQVAAPVLTAPSGSADFLFEFSIE